MPIVNSLSFYGYILIYPLKTIAMIKKISFSGLKNNELNTLVNRIIKAIKPLPKVNAGVVAKIFALLIELNKQLTKTLNTSFKTEHSDILKLLDGKRDDAFRALRDALLASSRRLNDTYRLHAQVLLRIFRIHGWSLWTDNYQEESSKLNSLMLELEKDEAKAALAVLNLTEWFQELKKAQVDFEVAFQNKANDDFRSDFVAIQSIRPELIKNVNDLLDRINSDSKYSDEAEVYTELVSTLNNILEESSVVAKSRKTRSGNNGVEKLVVS